MRRPAWRMPASGGAIVGLGGSRPLRSTGVPYHTVFGQIPSAEYQTWLAGVLPDAVSSVLPDSGHFPQLAHPVRFARLLASTARWPK